MTDKEKVKAYDEALERARAINNGKDVDVESQASLQNNNNIDLTKILKDCPKGWKFYSDKYGEVTFWGFSDLVYPIQLNTKNNGAKLLSEKGEEIIGNGKCILFPSIDQRDWSKFSTPWYKHEEKKETKRFDPKTLEVFDKVLARVYNGFWFADFVSVPGNDELCDIPSLVGSSNFNEVVPYNEETKHLLGTADEAPEYYQYVDEDDEWDDED